MTDIKSQFDALTQKIKTTPAQGAISPPAELKLRLYGLYRQAMDGDCLGAAPGMFDPIGRLKHQAWSQHRGMARDEAMRLYVESVENFARSAEPAASPR